MKTKKTPKKRRKKSGKQVTKITVSSRPKTSKTYEEFAYVLDVYAKKDSSYAQAIGDRYFNLLVLKLKPLDDKQSLILNRVFIGSSTERDIVERVQERISSAKKLTKQAGYNLKRAVYEIVRDRIFETENIGNAILLFFNFASPRGLRQIGLPNSNIYSLIKVRDAMLPKRFSNMLEVARALSKTGSRVDSYDITTMIRERVLYELEHGQGEAFSFLSFLANPVDYIEKNAARI